MRQRRFIFNNDGSFLLSNSLHGGRELTVDDVHGYVDQAAGTGVTSFFICSGSSMPYYSSRCERTIGCLNADTPAGDGGHPHGADNCALYGAHAQALARQGTDIIEQCVGRAHSQGMEAGISMRMNDLHFNDPAICFPLGQGDFWLQHPEYHLGDQAPKGWHTTGALDFSHQAVRQYKLDLFEEICTGYDADAVELDFMRFPVYFPAGQGSECTELMTEFVRQARQLVRDTAAQRGRPLELGIRLPVEMKGARFLGFDPVTYAREGLIDFITVTPFLHDVPCVPVEAFRGELGDDDVPLYAGMMSNAPSGPLSHGALRAHAANAYRAGADGLCLFNFFFLGDSEPEGRVVHGPCRHLLHELGDAAKLAGRNKLYDAGCRAGYADVDPAAELPAQIMPGEALELGISVAEAATPAMPPVLFVGTGSAGKLSCEWNGRALDRTDSSPADYGAGRDAGDDGQVTAFALSDAELRCGTNTVRLCASDGGELPDVELPVVELRCVELAVECGPVEECGRF